MKQYSGYAFDRVAVSASLVKSARERLHVTAVDPWLVGDSDLYVPIVTL